MNGEILTQYYKFLFNGGALGVAAIFLHAGIYHLLGSESDTIYAAASVLTYIPLVIVNFLIQKSLIFSSGGRFGRFIFSNLIIMGFVSAISPWCRDFLTLAFGTQIGEYFGFITAALVGATPSFLLARYWVFEE